MNIVFAALSSIQPKTIGVKQVPSSTVTSELYSKYSESIQPSTHSIHEPSSKLAN